MQIVLRLCNSSCSCMYLALFSLLIAACYSLIFFIISCLAGWYPFSSNLIFCISMLLAVAIILYNLVHIDYYCTYFTCFLQEVPCKSFTCIPVPVYLIFLADMAQKYQKYQHIVNVVIPSAISFVDDGALIFNIDSVFIIVVTNINAVFINLIAMQGRQGGKRWILY